MAENKQDAAPETPPRYRVTAEYVTVKTADVAGIVGGRAQGGYAIVGLYKGSFIPAGAPQETVARLLARGFIERFEEI